MELYDYDEKNIVLEKNCQNGYGALSEVYDLNNYKNDSKYFIK